MLAAFLGFDVLSLTPNIISLSSFDNIDYQLI